jgi:hypothetical protein
VLTRHLGDGGSGEPLLRHFGVHVRCLVAVPFFILAEGGLHRTVQKISSQLLSSGAVPPAQKSAFERSLQNVRRLRDSSLPWVLVLGVTVTMLLVNRPHAHDDAYSWAVSGDGTLGFGGWWFAYVARPVFVALLLGWLWRLLLLTWWFWRVGRLELSLVPSHPDRVAGLGLVERLPSAYLLVSFALSAVAASRWAHEIEYHGAVLKSFAVPAATFVVVWALIALMPLLALAPTLLALRARAVPAYAELVGEQGRLVDRRWIRREKIEDAPLLAAPEIGPVADASTMFEAVKRMGIVPIGKSTLAAILIPVAIPMLAVASMQVPLKDLLRDLVKTLL